MQKEIPNKVTNPLFIDDEHEKRFWDKLFKASPKDLERLNKWLDAEYKKEEAYLDKICDPITKTQILQKVHGLSGKEMKKVDLESLIITGKKGSERLDYKKGSKGITKIG